MSYLGSWKIDDYLPIPVTCHRFSSGAAYAATSLTYSIYEDVTTTGLDEDVDMTPASPFDSVVGFYLARRQLTAAAGFEKGKNYTVLIKATVDSVAAIAAHTFQIEAEVDANVVSGAATLAATQPAITWAQQKIVANVANEGALDCYNSNATGIGQYNHAPGIGQRNEATGEDGVGQENTNQNLFAGYGQVNMSYSEAGQKNSGVLKDVDGYDPALALEATLTAIKGAGWATETLKAIKDAVDAITGGGASASEVWTYGTRTITAATGLNLASASRVEAIQTTVNGIPTTDYTALISGRLSGSYLTSLASASRVEAIQADLDNPDQYKADVSGLASASTVTAIPTTDYTSLISGRLSGSYLASIASASRVEAIQTTVNGITGGGASASEIWAYGTRTITSASGLGLASASRVEAIQTDLDNPDQYKADVSGLASASSILAIPTTDYTGLISGRLSGSYLNNLASASSVENIVITSASTIWNYGARTLTSFGTALAGLSSSVWNYVTRTLTSRISVSNPIEEDDIECIRGDTLVHTFEDLPIAVGYKNVVMTIKRQYKDSDDESVLQITSGCGLLYLNGVISTTGSGASMYIDVTAETVVVEVEPEIMKDFPYRSDGFVYDLQITDSSDDVITPRIGKFDVIRDVTTGIT